MAKQEKSKFKMKLKKYLAKYRSGMLEYTQSMEKPTEEDEVCEEIKKKKKKQPEEQKSIFKIQELVKK